MDEEGINRMIGVFAIVIVLIAVVNMSVVFLKTADFREKITGYATNVTYGYVNITITQAIAINATRDTIDFGSGGVTSPNFNATMQTNGNGNNMTISRGDFPGVPNDGANVGPIIIANIGNLNCSIRAVSDKNATTFFGGSAANRAFKWNFSNNDTGACLDWNSTAFNGSSFADVNVTGETQVICNNLGYDIGGTSPYRLMMDALLTVPNDASQTDSQFATITLTGEAVIS
jgi:hypothetical protein